MSAPHPGSNGSAVKSTSSTPRAPRRLVLLDGAEDGEVVRVLAEYRGAEVSGTKLHAELQRLAEQHRGECVAAEWLGPLGWTRFLWCRKG